jgi:hypothetical protein
MKLWKAIKTFNVASLDVSKLEKQEEAFQACLSFLKGVEKSKTQNKRRGSYWLKHLIENPSGRFDIPSSDNCYAGYIYEGTFVLAALASGFGIQQFGKTIKATFNIHEPSLRRRAKEVCKERMSN